ncbi:MAG: ABC transporter ATP-binding protein [Verrucomicrobiales bacterium]|nr:ABC transporter ATP-binding protein [Verrucomicrobiales bacterium]
MIAVEQLSVRAGDFQIDGISFEVPTGEYGVLMGKTGCGKTTILEAICGLKEVVSGKITLMGRDVTRLRAGERGIGFVPQDGALFATMTVRQQLAFGPKVQGWSRTEIDERVSELAEELGIESILERKPFGLSGGERQRVALGRALAVRPQIICLDEPLSALDEETHEGMVELIRSVVKQHGITALHITHSRREADLISDKEFFLEKGRLVEIRD